MGFLEQLCPRDRRLLCYARQHNVHINSSRSLFSHHRSNEPVAGDPSFNVNILGLPWAINRGVCFILVVALLSNLRYGLV